MSLFHAVLWLDHHEARLLQFNAEQVELERVREHSHHTKQHGSEVRSQHEFYAEVCDRMAGIAEVLVTGSSQSQADFKHYLSKHRPALKAQVAGYETVDKPSDKQLVALARDFFVRYDRMNGLPSPL